MSRHLVLLPAPEAEWALLPAEEHEKGMRSHEQFHRDLAAGGHRLVAAGPLTPSAAGACRCGPTAPGGCSSPTGRSPSRSSRWWASTSSRPTDRADLRAHLRGVRGAR